ncbi:TraB/GumN family protein [Paraglaciecola aestuariivivens]
MNFKKFAVLGVSLVLASAVQAASVWKVSGKEHSLYIGGTIHVLTPDDYPLPKEYDLAFAQADKLVFETDIAAINTPAFGQKMMSLMMFNDGTTINQVLDPQTYKNLAIYLSSKNLPMQAFASHKPSLLAISLTFLELQALGYTSEGVDKFYSDKALQAGKPQFWLETPDEQLNFIANLGKDDPSAMIDYTLKDLQKMPNSFNALHNTWLKGDMQGMAEVGILSFKADYPQIYKDLLVTRNENWMPKIKNMLSDQPVEFILVGALHLAGPDSVLTKLKAQGYKVEKL